jgi:ribose/xylose/arabinose/galactoside ABC-type transport system permease subunit
METTMSDQGNTTMHITDRPRFFARAMADRRTVQALATLSVLVLMVIVFSLLSNRFLTVSNFQNLMRNTAPLAIAGCGMTAIMVARGLDLSVGSVLAASSVLAAALTVAGIPLAVALLLALVFGVSMSARSSLRSACST